jgi:hypothetical protein
MKHIGEETLYNVYMKRFKAYLALADGSLPAQTGSLAAQTGSLAAQTGSLAAETGSAISLDENPTDTEEKTSFSSASTETEGHKTDSDDGATKEGTEGGGKTGSGNAKEDGMGPAKAPEDGTVSETTAKEEEDSRLWLCELGRCKRLFTETVCLKVSFILASLVLSSQCCGSGSGIRCRFYPWIRDPGWVKNKDPDPGWTSRIIFPRA